MKQKNVKSDALADLRRRAEGKQKKNLKGTELSYADVDREKLIQEMEIHEIELKMQNEELKRLRNEAEILVEKYIDVYDFSPIAHLSLDPSGVIIMANLTAAEQFGTNRTALIGKRFPLLIAEQSLTIFNDLFKKTFLTKSLQTCELTLATSGQPPRIVEVKAKISPAGDECRLALTDITKRKKFEKAYRESEEKYRRLHESITEACASVDMSGRVTESNYAYQTMLGYTEEELRHLKYPDITPERWHAFEKRVVEEQLLEYGCSGVYEKEHQRKDGSVFPVEVTSFLIRDDNGKPVGMWGVVRDITARKKLEKELKAAKDYLNTVFNHVYDAIFVHNLDGKVIDVNDKMLEMYRVSREEAIGLNILRDYSATDESMEESLSNWNKVMSGEHIFTEWKAIRPKDGSVFDVEVFLTKLVLPDGNYILSNVRDITERKWAETALKESEEKYRQFFKTSRDFVFVTSKEGKIIDMNEAALELFGFVSIEELQQAKVPDLYVKPEEREDLYNRVLECGYVSEFPADMRRKDGSIRHTLVTAVGCYDANNSLTGFQGTVRDVTEQRRNEEELRKYREKLEILVAERTRELENKTKNLEEVNTALNVLLKKRENDRKMLEENFIANIGSLVLPYLEKIRRNNLDAQQKFFLDTVEKNLDEITSPLLKNIDKFNLTPREIKIAYLIKDGKTTKEIATALGIAEGSISTHRKNIRKKLGLDRTSNLQSQLRFLEK